MPFIHPDDLPACLEFLQKVMESGRKHQGMEYRVRHKDGTWRWHMSNASTMVTPGDTCPSLGVHCIYPPEECYCGSQNGNKPDIWKCN